MDPGGRGSSASRWGQPALLEPGPWPWGAGMNPTPPPARPGVLPPALPTSTPTSPRGSGAIFRLLLTQLSCLPRRWTDAVGVGGSSCLPVPVLGSRPAGGLVILDTRGGTALHPTHTDIHSVYTGTWTCRHTHGIQIHMHMHVHSRTCTHTYVHTHVGTHTHTHACAHTGRHTSTDARRHSWGAGGP